MRVIAKLSSAGRTASAGDITSFIDTFDEAVRRYFLFVYLVSSLPPCMGCGDIA
jgi:hypothetical protein